MRLFHVDAFTTTPFAGNPAAVVLLDQDRSERWMQLVAAEMNLPETAFVTSGTDGFSLRWFTPTIEVDLCGHATLASAHVLWETGDVGPDTPIAFRTASGVLGAERRAEQIWLDFPALDASIDADPPADLGVALGTTPVMVARGENFVLVELEDDDAVRQLEPDLVALRRRPERMVIVTATAQDTDFVSRMFAPNAGIDEDPVTGAAHCALGPFWAKRLGRNDLVGYQASRRGGTVHVHVTASRVGLGGDAVTVVRGTLASSERPLRRRGASPSASRIPPA
jgi:PhzF family phenazine biosynthesis protein